MNKTKFSLEGIVDAFTKASALEQEVAKLKAEKVESDKVSTELAELKKKYADTEKEKTDSQSTKTNLETQLATVKAEAEKVKTEKDAEVAKLKADLETAKTSLGNQLIEALASVGIKSGTIQEEVSTQAVEKKDKISIIRHTPTK